MIRTSDTDPLRIDELAIPAVPGLVGLTLCPGKVAKAANLGGFWKRDLEKDLAQIKGWGASVVVTLMEVHELQECQVPHLGERIMTFGLMWKHLPIVDAAVPDERFDTRWPEVASDLCSRLCAGERIVLHCRGGLGRTGLVAACLLIEFGMEAETAICRVRQARPGCIETSAQKEYVRRYQSVINRVSG